MAYWICVVNDENWAVVRSQHVWGVSKRWEKIISQVREGDLLIFYVIPKSLGGIFEAVSEPYYDESPIFYPVKAREEKFPYRVKLKPILLPKEHIDFTPLVPKLSFTKNKQYWSAPFRRAMFKIIEEDFKIIEEYLRRFVK